MKKFFSFAAIGLLLALFTACGHTNTPEGVATAAMQCMADKDYEGYVDLVYFKGDKKLSKEERAQFVALVEDKVGKQAEKNGGIKDFKIGIPELNGDKGSVPVEITYADESVKKQTIAVVKTPDGDWKLDAGK